MDLWGNFLALLAIVVMVGGLVWIDRHAGSSGSDDLGPGGWGSL